ncbi:MAG: hypothetical protein IJM30_03355 [Thermoguttaceae bacterium]|nr:hypothetical protein [Thermoguttaceae bacterium]
MQTTSLATESVPVARPTRGTTSETLASALFFFAQWAFWSARYGDYLFAAQENSIFLYRPEFLTRWASVPSGLMCWASAFLVQFFALPLVGGAILALLGVALQATTARVFRLRGGFLALSFLPSCFQIVSSTWPGYFIFIPYNLPIVFSGFLGALFALAGLAIYRSFGALATRLVFAVLFAGLGYLVFGAWSVVGGILFAIDEGTRLDSRPRKGANRLALGIVLVALAILVPVALWRFWLFPKLQFRNVFSCGIIEDVRYERDSLTALFTYGFARLVPVYLTAVYFVARLVRLSAGRAPSATTRAQRRAEKRARDGEKKDSERGALDERALEKRRAKLVFELLFLVCVATFFLAYHNRAYFDSLKEYRALTKADWETILEIDAKNPKPNTTMVGYRNLALFETGRLSEEAFARPIGYYQTRTLSLEEESKAAGGNPLARIKARLWFWKASTETSAFRAAHELAFCHYGLPNSGARVATDNLVAAEGRAVSFLKTLAFAAVINGEKELARRYLREIEGSIFHKRWARARLAYLETNNFREGAPIVFTDPDYQKREEDARAALQGLPSLGEIADQRGVSLDELKKIDALVSSARDLLPKKSGISNKSHPNLAFLINVVEFDDYEAGSPRKKELALVSALMQKKKDVYLKYIDDYLALNGWSKGGAPRALEEGLAAWRYGEFDEKWNDCEYQFSPYVVEKMTYFIDYTRTFGASTLEQQELLRQTFSGDYVGFAVDDSVYK